jgi:hypothetical protein
MCVQDRCELTQAWMYVVRQFWSNVVCVLRKDSLFEPALRPFIVQG